MPNRVPLPNAAEMQHAVTLQKRFFVAGTRGQNSAVWESRASFSVKLETLNGLELIRARKKWERSTYAIDAYFTTAFTPTAGDRLKFGTRYLDIGHVENVDERNSAWRILAAEETSGAPFSPPQLSKLLAWYRSAVTTSLELDGSDVDVWNDLSGQDTHLAASGAARPSSGTTIGQYNLNEVKFDGTDEVIRSPYFPQIEQPFTVVLLVDPDKVNSDQFVFANRGANPCDLANDGSPRMWSLDCGTRLESTYEATTACAIVTFVANGSSSLIRVDGVEVASGDAGSNKLLGIVLGADDAETAFYDGGIGEVIVYAADKSADLADLESYLSQEYGVTLG